MKGSRKCRILALFLLPMRPEDSIHCQKFTTLDREVESGDPHPIGAVTFNHIADLEGQGVEARSYSGSDDGCGSGVRSVRRPSILPCCCSMLTIMKKVYVTDTCLGPVVVRPGMLCYLISTIMSIDVSRLWEYYTDFTSGWRDQRTIGLRCSICFALRDTSSIKRLESLEKTRMYEVGVLQRHLNKGPHRAPQPVIPASARARAASD